MAIITSKVKNNESLMSLDENDDEIPGDDLDYNGVSVHSKADRNMFENSFV
jgi:hypothetical protein